MAAPDSYFVRLSSARFVATERTAGAWSTSEQHFSPMAGLITHEVERFVAARGADDLRMARITFEILGTIAIEEFQIEVSVLRPGRTIELLEATCIARGRPVVRARMWRLATLDTTAIETGLPPAMPGPDRMPATDMTTVWPGEFISWLEFRRLEEPSHGRARAWVRTPLELVLGEESSALARLIGLVDTMNGIGPPVRPDEWFFPNVDLSIQLWRTPTGGWLGLETTVAFGRAGIGVTSAVLHDVEGPIGRAQQTLTIRPR